MTRPVTAAIGCIVLAAAAGARAEEPAAATAAAVAASTPADPAQAGGTQPNDAPRQELETVTVTTGTRSAKAVDKIPGAITVVSRAEIGRTLALTDDATAVLARSVPGYAESSQAMSNTGENLRGRIPLRLFDGIPQGSPLREGTRNGTFTDMGIVDRIEVINGPSAAEGIGAAGGIINYISKTPTKEGDEYTLNLRTSSQFKNDSAVYKVGVNWAHKQDNFDMYLAGSYIDRGMTWDGNGRRVGMNQSGSVADSTSDNLFAKFGYNFGTDNAQRVQLTLTKFKIEGKDNYIEQLGDRSKGITDTSVRGHNPGSYTPFNDFWQAQIKYQHADFFGGTLTMDAYRASQAMRYLPENTVDKQDPDIAPINTLIDQSEINSQKKGFRTSWTRPDILGVSGLELRTGIDLVEDTAQQKLAITNRLWVPPMDYQSWAPYVQLSWDLGPVTLSGGFRQENGTLDVDSYRTTWYRNKVFVQGGSIDYKANLPNLGAIYRLSDEWSVFGSWGKGFTLPNAGIPLRNISVPGQSVSQMKDLQAIIVENKEIGFNWRGERAALSGSVYKSSSQLGVSLTVDPATKDYVMNRAPVDIKGVELSGEYKFSDDWKASMVYSKIMGYTTFVKNGPMDRHMGVSDINPNKLVTSLTWNYSERGDMTLGQTTLFSRTINQNTTAYEKTKGYTLWDFELNYDAGKFGKLTLGIENLTDKFYILSYSQVDGYQNYFAGRGRVVSISDKITF
ncbi:MAG: TonB-dependent receptor [Rudaea sp.]|uniref:TonB-dependent receptor n=1 Tax=unclassified Rudaea TaxID=2627037 RepID=UPI0010F89DAC|nr:MULTISPECIES: TonB-dependent receptor [unclassified Rudaea]MBN8885202.1 TonB-dependent receptor [Rudaea sp.]